MEKMYKKKSISEYKEGNDVSDIFVVKFKKGLTPYAKGFSFSLVLTDSSGKSLDYKYWGGGDELKVKSLYDSIQDDSVLYIEGKISSYNSRLQASSNEGLHSVKVLEKGMYDEQDFIKKTSKSIDEMYSQLESYVEQVKEPKLKILLKTILSEKGSLLKKHPAAISIHH